MCEIMGISFSSPGRPEFFIKKFLKRGVQYSSGWGLGFYPDKSAQIIKEHNKPDKSSVNIFLRDITSFSSNIFLGQLRNNTIGSTRHCNNHPFSRELNGKEYLFVHNGTAFRFRDLETGHFKPIGDTDSEYIFCHLMNHLSQKKEDKWGQKDFKSLSDFFSDMGRLGTVNCIFSDGEYLFTYYDKIDGYGLHFTTVKSAEYDPKTWMNI